MKTLDKLKKQQVALIDKATTFIYDGELPMVVAVIKRLITLLPQIQKVQPDITGYYFGMGGGWFRGVVHGYQTEDNTPYDMNANDLSDYLGDPKGYDYEANVNAAMYEALELIKYFVFFENDHYNLLQPEGLNASTMIDEIKGDVVIFERDEVVNSPFGHEPKATTENSKFYKMLVKAGIKTQFVPQR